jgi:mannose-6-phosphate isomerase-like protein (cupin superfamily)
MLEQIKHKEATLAIIIKANYKKPGISFFTPDDFSQQLGYMNRPTGYVIEPHMHKLVERKVILTQEVLYIKSGKIRVDFYDDDRKYIENRILEAGDVILLAMGGHGFEVIEEVEMIEIKQGPYCGDEDKVRFDTKNSK